MHSIEKGSMKSKHNLWSAFPKEVQEWFRAGAPSGSGNDEIADLLAELASWIRNEEIVVTRESQSFFDLMEKRYPIGFHRIDWSRVPGHFYMDVLEMKSGQDVDFKTQVEKLLQIRTTVEELV